MALISEGRSSNCGRFGLILDVFIPQSKCALTVVDMNASLKKELIAIVIIIIITIIIIIMIIIIMKKFY